MTLSAGHRQLRHRTGSLAGVLPNEEKHGKVIFGGTTAIRDDGFWRHVVGCERPYIPGQGRKKLLKITKPLEDD